MNSDVAVEDSVETEVNERLRTVISQGVGQASLCWENLGSDVVFDSALAIKVGESLLYEVQQVIADLLG